MHGEAVGVGEHGLGVTPSVAFAYLLVAGFLMGCARYAKVEPRPAADDTEDAGLMHPAPAE
jgi:AGZA family xanthine/uracil permease-like MFS transporter